MALERSELFPTAITGQHEAVPLPIARSRAKRAIDVAIATVGLAALIPLMLLIAMAILATSGRPVLFAQARVGKHGRTFTCWKFRTMVRDAELLREDLIGLNEAPFPAFKLSRDPRVTRVGRFLRMSSFDELPQLWNVFRGDMSIVGPRPPLPSEVAHYDASAMQRLAARPGLTCTWQIHSRNRSAMTFDEWVRSDLDYIRTWSLVVDLRLMVRTLAEVIRMSGR
jgi:lipopolysaccharide/colanic/teichoic acid biosynthesis glycosyltransferase